MDTALIVLNYNNYEDTVNCIESVEAYNSAPIKYIVVDNGSTMDGVTTSLDAYFRRRFNNSYKRFDYEQDDVPDSLPYVSFVVSNTNDGYARGNNKGLEYAYADDEIDKILIVNNDVLFVQDIIPQLSNTIDSIDNCAILSPLLLKKDGVSIDYNCARLAPSVWQILLPYFVMYKDIAGVITKTRKKLQIIKKNPLILSEQIVPIELPSGSCMMIKKSLMKEIDGFDPHTFLFYEENILYKKLYHLGKRSFMIPKLKCIHLGASTTKKSASTFTMKVGMKSSQYYLGNYCHLTILHKMAMIVSYFNMKLKLRIIEIIKS